MKKVKKIIVLFLISAILGVLISFLKHSGYLHLFYQSFKSLKWYLYLPLLIIFFILVILVHELGHLIVFLFNKIKIRAIHVLIFSVYKRYNNKYKFKVNFRNIKFIGGIVVPDIKEIKSNEDFNNFRNIFSKALIAGPNTSIIYLILSSLLFLLSWFLKASSLLIIISFLNFIVVFLVTILIIMTSKLNTNEVYGDYVARKLMKEDEKFALAQAFQSMMFSSYDINESNEYLYNYVTKFYENNNLTYNIFDISIISNYINIYLFNELYKENKLTKKIKNSYNINRLSRSKHGLELAYLISAMYYKEDKLDKAFETFNLININKNRHISNEQQLLLKKEYAHLLNLENNENYFMNNKQLIKDELFIFAPLFDVDKLIEDLNKKLPYKKYYTKLYCNIKEGD